ncbi:hypothetical protein B0A55_06052 [Friedmanniomyces simplex]|uniref:Transcription factor domain-containing protein n=1 Tax=Friedmanniomyces simplex TaxID=329884 RepID=A0A4U0X9E3_9PEZI|nr:hypothetical protein B0A55_06052 [Friedmanniomyces simplex]
MPSGFAFISVGDPGKSSDADRLLIRSHVMRGRNKRLGSRRSIREAVRQTEAPPATTTTTPTAIRSLRRTLRESTRSSLEPADVEPAARQQDEGERKKQSGEKFKAACVQLDQQIQTRSGVFASLDNSETGCGELISELLTYDTAKNAAFPLKYSIEFDEPENACVPWMFSNTAFAHSVFFATSATNDFRLGRPFTRPTLIHLKRTIRCLNKQLSEAGGHLDDSTTYTIITLAMLATLFGDLTAVRAHMVGLQRIIGLRGGESYLCERPKQYYMLERLDLAWSVHSVGAVSVFEPSELWLRAIWSNTATPGERWEDVQQQLESVLWIGNIQDETGRCAYAALTQ